MSSSVISESPDSKASSPWRAVGGAAELLEDPTEVVDELLEQDVSPGGAAELLEDPTEVVEEVLEQDVSPSGAGELLDDPRRWLWYWHMM